MRALPVTSDEEMTSAELAIAGEVASIKRFMLHDGPGIRSVVFLKGCPLRCVWCSSPFTWKGRKDLVYRVGKCIHCGVCIRACPEGALSANEDGTIVVDQSRCIGCGECVEVCPTTARIFDSTTMDVKEVLAVLERDRAFYEQSGGGVTFSGGEPTAHANFLLALLKACRRAGFHTAIETSGFVNWKVFQRLLPWIDLVLYDIKAMNPDQHEELTGQRNDIILANLARIAKAGTPPVEVHVPVIPGKNDSDRFFEELAAWLGGLGIKDIAFLPFHKLGSHEYEELGMNYPLENAESISGERMEQIRERFRSLSFRVRV
jgi:pyruvate formate lyase activating enzyme